MPATRGWLQHKESDPPGEGFQRIVPGENEFEQRQEYCQ